jgi:hypothetical protein
MDYQAEFKDMLMRSLMKYTMKDQTTGKDIDESDDMVTDDIMKPMISTDNKQQIAI